MTTNAVVPAPMVDLEQSVHSTMANLNSFSTRTINKGSGVGNCYSDYAPADEMQVGSIAANNLMKGFEPINYFSRLSPFHPTPGK